jgi:hypothetical protein
MVGRLKCMTNTLRHATFPPHPHTLLEDAKSLHATKEKYQNTAIN